MNSPFKPEPPKSFRGLAIAISIAALSLCGAGILVLVAPPPPPAPQPVPNPIQQPAKPSARQVSNSIPGLTAADVHLSFKHLGFACHPMEIQGGGQCRWLCEENRPNHSHSVEIFGSGPTQIDMVRMTTLNHGAKPTDDVARDFLAYAASLPYDGARPVDAKAWVARSIGTTASTQFGGITFELIAASPRSRMLIIRQSP